MKKIFSILTLSAAVLLAASCEDFLTKAPETNMSPESYFKSKAELEMWTNNFYADILPTAEDIVAQVADDHYTSSLNAIEKGTRTPSSKSWNEDTWKPLRRINYFFENNKCTDASASAMYEGVAYFFRAMFYFEKVRQYGDMPYYDKVIGSSDASLLNRPRDPRGYVMLKVCQDLDKAYELLPEKWEAYSVYKVTKDAAMALKSRAALFEGTFRKYHSGTEYVPEDEQTFDGVTISSKWFLEQAADAASKVMGKRSLYTGNTLGLASKAAKASYREYFILEDAETSETILSRRYNVDLLIRHGIQFNMKNGRHSATNRFVNHYLQSDGTPIQNRSGWQTLSYYDEFQNRDPRMEQTLHGPAYVAYEGKGHETLTFDRNLSGYRIIKFISSTDHENATTSTTDLPVIRYAEVLLNYAEAKAELGTLTPDDLAKTVNVIRARVGMPGLSAVPADPDALMKEYYPNAKGEQLAAILEIRRERTVELFCEGFRQWDLLRWNEGKWITPKSTGGFQGIYIPGFGEYDLDKDGKMDICVYDGSGPAPKTNVPATNVIGTGAGWTLSDGTSGYLTYHASEDYIWNDSRDYLWPIPVDQRSLTGGALSQNPGWDDGYNG
ncbi:MAG: RagB/SusD family nutrient uptake outer membrane protein [Bacteroidales bacterium]|nr:RagB/SusD family nutrient uptake outer membrane protein [Bacteroidales bacterium]